MLGRGQRRHHQPLQRCRWPRRGAVRTVHQGRMQGACSATQGHTSSAGSGFSLWQGRLSATASGPESDALNKAVHAIFRSHHLGCMKSLVLAASEGPPSRLKAADPACPARHGPGPLPHWVARRGGQGQLQGSVRHVHNTILVCQCSEGQEPPVAGAMQLPPHSIRASQLSSPFHPCQPSLAHLCQQGHPLLLVSLDVAQWELLNCQWQLELGADGSCTP